MKAEGGRRRAEGGRWRADRAERGSGLVALRTPYFVLRTLPVSSALRLPPSALVYLVGIAVLWFAAAARAADPPQAVWLISTRSAPHCGELDGSLETLRYWRLTEDCDWSSADAKDFQATDDAAVPTVVFIPGNRTDADDAVVKGWYVYEAIQSQSAGRAVRYVIWSWPADRVCRRNRPDAQLKAAYSDVESYYLALWLNNLRPGAKVSLVGHSFGPRIITGAMHLLAGGEVAGQKLPEDTVAAWTAGKRNPVRAVLLGAAVGRRCARARRRRRPGPLLVRPGARSPATAAIGCCGGIRGFTAAAARKPWGGSAPAALTATARKRSTWST